MPPVRICEQRERLSPKCCTDVQNQSHHSMVQTWKDYHGNKTNHWATHKLLACEQSKPKSPQHNSSTKTEALCGSKLPAASVHGPPLLPLRVHTDRFSMQRDRKLLPWTSFAYVQTGNRKLSIALQTQTCIQPFMKNVLERL